MLKYFDIHSHLDYPDYQSDFDGVISRMAESAVGTITIGTDLASSRRAVSLAEKYQNVWACIGIHPADNHREFWREDEFAALVKNPKVVAIGECGLDFFRLNPDSDNFETEKQRQQNLFKKQIEFAARHDKTLMIHCRDAYQETYEILKEAKNANPRLRIHLHFYAGDLATTKKFLELDATFSFTGVITFADQYDEVIKFLPVSKILSETDAPFVAPTPHRGKRNEPAYVIEVVKKLAALKQIDLEKMRDILLQNTERVFKIDTCR